ncbi:MAG: FAD binding domain-containing protein, partial [Acidobacteria bacterium]|nr:FAD binding domain-containing protein [Acidobacteriota bacterium]
MRPALRIVRRGRVTNLEGFAPTETLLEHLRLREGATGTKEGCAEGDCGACTVAVGRLRDGRVVYEPTNSCIQLLGSLDGAEVVTVDDLASSATDLHPVQQALVDHHASQCGFCTPGFVMTLFALYHANERPDRAAVNEWLAGNLCRCTGYRPIADAALASCGDAPQDEFTRNAGRTAEQLATLDDGQDLFVGNDEMFFAAPASEDSLAHLCARHPEAVITGGATDVGLWITKELRDLPRIIHTGRVPSLRAVSEERDRVELGAAATYAEAESALSGIDPDVGEVLQRLGSKQVRALGTVGGNIANGSPIGDMP